MRQSIIIILGLLIIAACREKNDPIVIDPCGIDFETTLHYVAIGDGFSSGVFLEDGEAWPHFVKTRLMELNYEVTDFEIVGGISSTISELITDTNVPETDCKNLVTVMAGSNDHFAGTSEEDFRTNYQALITRAKSIAGSSSRVTCVSLPDYSSTPGLPASAGTEAEAEAAIITYNEIIFEEALDAGVNYANIFPLSESAYENLDAYVPEDELHGNVFNNNLWGEIVVAVLEANL